jgi:hypothetical protein
MKYIYLCTLLFFIYSLKAQEFKKVYEHDIDKSIGTLLEGDLTDFEISPSADYVMVLTSENIKTLDKNGDVIFEYQCVPKSNSSASLFSDFIGGELGNMVSNIKLDEGNGFWLFEEDNLINVLDWNLENNLVIAYDLDSGENCGKEINIVTPQAKISN